MKATFGLRASPRHSSLQVVIQGDKAFMGLRCILGSNLGFRVPRIALQGLDHGEVSVMVPSYHGNQTGHYTYMGIMAKKMQATI